MLISENEDISKETLCFFNALHTYGDLKLI